jgi:periplasmic protein CpxP/Spy
MNKLNTLYVLSITMLIINGFLIFKLFVNQNHLKPKMRPPHQILVERLEFSEFQKQALDTLYFSREDSLRHLSNKLRVYKNSLFEYAKTGNYNQRFVNQTSEGIGITMKQMDIKVFEMLRGIRQICDEKQKKKFDEIFKEIFHREGDKQHFFKQEVAVK